MKNWLKKYVILGIFGLSIICNLFFTSGRSINDDQPDDCSIITVTQADKAYFCSNLDFKPYHWRMTFFPASAEKYAKMLYGYTYYHSFEPVAGMNEHGLCADDNGIQFIRYTPIPSKPTFSKPDMYAVILEVCKNVSEVIEWVNSYNLLTFNIQSVQYHFADPTGDACVIGLDAEGNLNITRKTGPYLLSTNFALAREPGTCWRYDTAKEMLDNMAELNFTFCSSLLEAISFNKTRYSSITDLKTRMIYIYSFAQFDHYATIDMDQEFSKGYHSYDIEQLVNRQNNSMLPTWVIVSTYVFMGVVLVGCTIVYFKKIHPKLKYLAQKEVK